MDSHGPTPANQGEAEARAQRGRTSAESERQRWPSGDAPAESSHGPPGEDDCIDPQEEMRCALARIEDHIREQDDNPWKTLRLIEGELEKLTVEIRSEVTRDW